MNKAFIVICANPHVMGFEMVEVHLKRESAEESAKLLNSQIPEEDKPEHDEYGLTKGHEYQVIPLTLK